MTVNSQLRMVDSAMRGQAIGIGGDLRPRSWAIGGVDPVSVDTCAVPREAHPPACPPANLARLTPQQDPQSSNADTEKQGQEGGQVQGETGANKLGASV